LMQSPSFTALSYAWGTSKPSREIELDGCLMLVSQNLLDALVELQADESTSQKLFWIDAICINQRDIAEKSTQVQMMGDIYRRASEVIAWLGKEDSGAVLALESIASIHECQSSLDNLLHRFDFDAVVKAVGKLIEREWWRRLWVIQELVLS
ncbi:heterokaryon incompatibility, partial [Ophiobolus disseminans]